VKIARGLEFDPGTVIVYDRDIMITPCLVNGRLKASFFVTRMKDNALYEVVGEEIFLETGISEDELIQLIGPRLREVPLSSPEDRGLCPGDQ